MMKTAGLDYLKPVVLQHIGDETLATIIYFFKRSMISSLISKRLHQMKVVFIQKLEKEDYSGPQAYRPITFLTFS